MLIMGNNDNICYHVDPISKNYIATYFKINPIKPHAAWYKFEKKQMGT